jgi:hypothetical protein
LPSILSPSSSSPLQDLNTASNFTGVVHPDDNLIEKPLGAEVYGGNDHAHLAVNCAKINSKNAGEERDSPANRRVQMAACTLPDNYLLST